MSEVGERMGGMEIVEFLEARFADDEAGANAMTASGPWSDFGTSWDEVGGDARVASFHMDDCGTHVEITSKVHDCAIARDFLMSNNPARLLREVEAKRAILVEHAPVNMYQPLGPDCRACGDRWVNEYADDSFGAVDWPCVAVRAVLSVYSDHPEYSPTWAVEAAQV